MFTSTFHLRCHSQCYRILCKEKMHFYAESCMRQPFTPSQYKVNDKLKKKSKKSIIVNKIIVVWDIKSIICHITYNWVNGKIYINMCFLSRETLFILYLWVEKVFLMTLLSESLSFIQERTAAPFSYVIQKG